MSEERKGYLYRHVRLDTNEVFYIGIGFDNTFKRSRSKSSRNNFWKNIVAKTDYEVEIMLGDIPKSLLFKKEIEFIKLYGRRDLGLGTLLNLTGGGEGSLGSKTSLGRKFSEEHKLKLSKAHLGRKRTEATRLKISNGHKGIKFSEEHKLNLSKANKGRKPSEETMRKALLANCKKVTQKNLDGSVVKIWDSAAEAGRHGFNESCINACRNKSPRSNTHKGFLWEFCK